MPSEPQRWNQSCTSRTKASSTAARRTIFEAEKKKNPKSGTQWELDTRNRVSYCLLSRHRIVSALSSPLLHRRSCLLRHWAGHGEKDNVDALTGEALSRHKTDRPQPSRLRQHHPLLEWVIARAQVSPLHVPGFSLGTPFLGPRLPGRVHRGYQENALQPGPAGLLRD